MNPLHWLARPELAALALALVHFLWQGTLIALLLAAVLRLGRIKGASQRYACSLAALLAMALCPVITYLAIGPQSDLPAALTSQQESTGAYDDRTTSAAAASATDSWWQALAAVGRGVQPYLLALWLAGVLALGLRLIGGLVGVVRLSRHKFPLPLDLASRVEELGKALRIDALSRVFLSVKVSEALVIGFWRPVVLVPAAWAAEMPLAALEAIVAHELAHIRRWDLWVNLLQRVVETLLFYHPAVWWVSRRLSQEREMCCDELAVGATGRRIEYVETLELVARERLAGVRPALAAGIRGESNMKLLARVRNLLGGPAGESFGLWPAGLLALLLPLALWTVTLGVLSPSPAAAVAADDDRDDDDDDDGDVRDDDGDDGDDDDDEKKGDRKAANREREDDDGDDDDDDDKKGDRKAANREREDDDDDEGDRKAAKREREDDDDDDGDEKKAAGRKRDDDEAAADKKALLKKFLDVHKEAAKEGERKEGDAPKKELKEGDAPKKERKEGELPKKVIKEGEQPKKVVKEGELPKKVIKEGEAPIKKVLADKDAVLALKKKNATLAEGKGEGAADLAAMVKELRGEVEKLRAEVRELRGGKSLGEGESGKIKEKELTQKKAEAGDKEALIRKIKQVEEKERAAGREAGERKELEARERAAIEQKLREVARDKERAAEREAAERKEREDKELELKKRKEGERKEDKDRAK